MTSWPDHVWLCKRHAEPIGKRVPVLCRVPASPRGCWQTGPAPACAVWEPLNRRLLSGKLPRNLLAFSSRLEDHTMGCQNSPCRVATGLAVADATTLTSVQKWLSLVPWSSGYVDAERCVLLQMLVPAAHKALAESYTHSTLFPILICSGFAFALSPSWGCAG